jgi:preprotein translocase subunit YajC
MKRTARLVVLALGAAMVAAAGHAQEDNGMGPPDGGDGMGQVFGRGNGVRGTVTAAASDSFTIRTDEGDTYKVFYSANTRLMKDRQPIEAADIHVGDMLMAGGLVDAKAKTVGAVLLYDIDAQEVRKARAGFGKTWVMGKVTAIHELRITIERAGDKQTQIVAVDENTSFRKHREDVTLADVKVGDMISAEGGLHADTFVATNLRIMNPEAGRPHGAGRETGQPPGSTAPQ